MEISKKKLVGSYIAVLTVGLVIGALLFYPIGVSKQWFVDISLTAKGWHNRVDVTIYRANGTIEKYSTPNIVVTIGLKRIRNFLNGNASDPTNATKYITLSNDASPDASWTKLPNEYTSYGLERAEGTVTILNATALKIEHTWTCTADSIQVQCTGLHWDPTSNSDGNLFAVATFTQVTLNTNDQIKIAWTANAKSG